MCTTRRKIELPFKIQRTTTRSACTVVYLRSNAKVSFVLTVSNEANATVTDLSGTIGRVESFHLRDYNC